MSQYLPFIVIGLTTGSIYGLAGIGLVLTYKTTGVFNFGYGAIAALSAFVFYFLRTQHGWAWPLAFFTCLLVVGGGFGIAYERLARYLSTADTAIKVASTVGIILVAVAVGDLWYPGNTDTVTSFLPQKSVEILGVAVSWEQIFIFFGAIIITGLLYALFRWFRLGVAMRGAVDDPQLLARTGENPVRVRQWACVLGALLAAGSGMLVSPGLGLDALVLTLLVVQAFGAAAIGTFSSLPLTFVGGLVIGVVVSLATKFTAQVPALGGLSDGLPFIILFIVLLITPKRRLVDRSPRPVILMPKSWHAPTRVRLVSGVIALAFLVWVPELVGVRLVSYSNFLIYTILFLSLGLLVRTSGQACLCQMAFVSIGMVTAAHLMTFGVPWLLSVLIASIIVIPVGALVAIPAIRLSGIYLALATFGFGLLVESVFYPLNFLFGVNSNGIPAARPSGSIGAWHFDTTRGYYYVLLVFLVAVVATIIWIERGRLGRLLTAMADSPAALQSGGASLVTAKVLIFCISAFIAALAGALTGPLYGFAESTQYPSFDSLTLFAAVVILTMGGPWYAFLGAAGLALIPAYLTSVTNINTYLQLFFGVSALTFVMVAQRPPSVPAWIRQKMDAWRRVPPLSAAALAADEHSDESTRPQVGDVSGLEVANLSVSYGGVVAVRDVSLKAPVGTITGLVGPNGAGKSTLFAACSGLVKPRGEVFLNGQVVTKKSPQQRARLGLGRTFQRVELYDSLTVMENVSMGSEALLAGGKPSSQLLAGRGQGKVVTEAVLDAVSIVGIAELAERQVVYLSTGQRRLVELARALAGTYDILLLDEPSSGLDAVETQNFGQALRRAVDERGVGILLVEHDMTLVQAVCSHVYMLEYGSLIFEGTPAEMHQSDVVRAAYLGVEVTEQNAPDQGVVAVP
jgi:ABC-type branched-subunit amino acid transport system ATPase component/branched-subunit amino acid ABC-type transport system permease component